MGGNNDAMMVVLVIGPIIKNYVIILITHISLLQMECGKYEAVAIV